MMKIKQTAEIIKKELLAPDIYSMTFSTDMCDKAEPGQFVMIYPDDKSKLLGRPICIAEAGIAEAGIAGSDMTRPMPQSGETDKNIGNAAGRMGFLRIVFRLVGDGTREIVSHEIGESLSIEGPLGHGYPTDDALIHNKDILLLGGGLGAPSLLFLARQLADISAADRVMAVLGYRDGSLNHFLAPDFEKLGIKTIIATDDGSEGIHGNVIEAVKQTTARADIIYACGPMPMLSAVKHYGAEVGAAAYISLEERMACGVGVCLGCVAKTIKEDAHSHVRNARVCTEGPVFDASEVDLP